MEPEISLDALPMEIWCHIFSFLETGNGLLKVRALCRDLRDIVDENLKKRIKSIVDGFETRCGGKHSKKSKKEGCVRLMYLGDFRKKRDELRRHPHPLPPTKEAPQPLCKDCGLETKRKSPLIFHLAFVDEELPFDTFLRIMGEFKNRICVPGRQTKEKDVLVFKNAVERFLVQRFGMRWTERNKKEILDGCDWDCKNKQLRDILRK
nr:f-box containing protein [Marseillevirus cajuinensis]